MQPSRLKGFLRCKIVVLQRLLCTSAVAGKETRGESVAGKTMFGNPHAAGYEDVYQLRPEGIAQHTPRPIMALATFMKPAMLAPFM